MHISGKKGRRFENGSLEGRHVEITGPIIDGQTSVSSSERESPIPNISQHSKSKSTSPRARSGTLQSEDGGTWKTSPLYASSSEGEDDDEVPDMLKRFSQNGFLGSGKQSDTMTSDVIVNSISSGKNALVSGVRIHMALAVVVGRGTLVGTSEFVRESSCDYKHFSGSLEELSIEILVKNP